MGNARRNTAILLAGGVGTRVGLSTPKQLIEMRGRPILDYSLAALDQHDAVDDIVVMMAPDHLDAAREIVRNAGHSKVRDILEGGATRSDTTRRALGALGDLDCKVLLHDAVRPLVTARVISECFDALDSYDAVGVAIPSADTIISVTEANTILDIPARSSLRRIQTPQAFRASIIKRAHEIAAQDPDFVATDDCAVVLRYLPDVPIWLVEGDTRNIKVTEPLDVYLVEQLLQLDSQAPSEARDRGSAQP